MPCGGIFPVSDGAHYPCWHCNELGSDHFVEEWDAFIHAGCIIPFLHSEEGEIVLAHKHYIQIDMFVLQEEDGELMDPNETLKEIRELVKELGEVGCADSVSGPALNQVQELVNKIENLDGWISNGGFLPAEWDNGRNVTR